MTQHLSLIQMKFFWQCLRHTVHTNLMDMLNWNQRETVATMTLISEILALADISCHLHHC